MKSREFFKTITLESVLEHIETFPHMEKETVPLEICQDRVLADDIISDIDLPDFMRSTVDGYAVQASSTFGASEGTPALFKVVGGVEMGRPPNISVGPGEAVKIPTGGMLPHGCDSVVMVEHTQPLDQETIEVLKSCAPLQNVVEIGEDVAKGKKVLERGRRIRPSEVGLLAALGITTVPVFRQPTVAIISSGDEIVPVEVQPHLGQLRDVNGYTLMGMVKKAGGIPLYMGIVRDRFEDLFQYCQEALSRADIVVLSGGSSIGTRDFTIDVIQVFPDSQILAHGVSISPGKPTILARIGRKAFWGLPGHTVSAMITFLVMVSPLIEKMSGLLPRFRNTSYRIPAILSRNVASAMGRVDFIRVRLTRDGDRTYAHPILGKSGLIHTMVNADGLIKIDINSEGLDRGSEVEVIMF
nr:molybdopterin molybdotransferase MoeA [Desulfobacterales bacterium]